MKCSCCGTTYREPVKFCVRCGNRLLPEGRPGIEQYLLQEKIISDAAELDKTVTLSFDQRSDDGLLEEEPLIEVVTCSLYDDHQAVLQALVRCGAIPSTRYYSIREFTAGMRTVPLVLAEVLHGLPEPRLTLVYGHRQSMIDRAGPAMCLYGCPTSAALEEQYAAVTYHTELLDLP